MGLINDMTQQLQLHIMFQLDTYSDIVESSSLYSAVNKFAFIAQADSSTPNNRVIMRMMVGRGDLQFNITLNHGWGGVLLFFPFPKFYIGQR